MQLEFSRQSQDLVDAYGVFGDHLGHDCHEDRIEQKYPGESLGQSLFRITLGPTVTNLSVNVDLLNVPEGNFVELRKFRIMAAPYLK